MDPKPMNLFITLILFFFSIFSITSAQFYGDPPDETHPWAVHDNNRPQPMKVKPSALPGDPPSDAIILFDGTKNSFFKNWEHENPRRKKNWIVRNQRLISVKGAGSLISKAKFADCQLHIEWSAPMKIVGSGQGRGNSGVFLMGETEVQILDNYNNPTYPDGFAGSVYGVMPPMVNALKPPGKWQIYDIIFRRPVLKDGKILDEGSLTVFLNGVVVQDNTPLEGGGLHKKRSKSRAFPIVGPLKLQDHGNPVQFRNIWYRELRKRPIEGGTDGALSSTASNEKRMEIAETILNKTQNEDGIKKLLLLMEALCYKNDDEVRLAVHRLSEKIIMDIKKYPEGNENDAKQIYQALKYLERHKIVDTEHPNTVSLEKIIKKEGWAK